MAFTILSGYLLTFNIVTAEEKYRPGFIITNSNDTVRGYLQQLNINSFTKCNFRKSMNERVIEYLPGTIAAYRYDHDGRFYVSKEAPLESGNKVLFLEYLIQGKANIYFMRDDMDRFFIETDSNKIMELSQNPKLIHDEEGNQYYKREGFRGKLLFMLSDCPEIEPEINKTELQPASMIKLAKDYHKKICSSEQCIIFERKIKPVIVHLSIVGGISLNKFEFRDKYTDFSTGGTLGCKIEFNNLLFSSEQSTFQLGVLFQNYSTFIVNQDNAGYTGYSIPKDLSYSVNLNIIALNIPVTYNYTFTFGKIRSYFGVGVANVFASSNNRSFSTSFGNDEKTFPLYRIGYIGTIGAKYRWKNNHDIIAELSYNANQEFYRIDPYYNLKNKNLSFIVGYTL